MSYERLDKNGLEYLLGLLKTKIDSGGGGSGGNSFKEGTSKAGATATTLYFIYSGTYVPVTPGGDDSFKEGTSKAGAIATTLYFIYNN